MKRCIFKKRLVLLFLILICADSCNKTDKTPGYLEGIISIGPLCPVERIPPDPACLPTAETYKAYPVTVYNVEGNKKVAMLSPSLDGFYILDLFPGQYKVVLEKPQNNIGTSNLPYEISITSMDTTLLNINIDTGIR